MTSSTPVNAFRHEDQVYTASTATQAGPKEPLPSETRVARRALGRVSASAATVAAAAALFGPAPPDAVSRVVADSDLVTSQAVELNWEGGPELALHSARTTQEEIDELNRLYETAPSEGIWQPFPDA